MHVKTSPFQVRRLGSFIASFYIPFVTSLSCCCNHHNFQLEGLQTAISLPLPIPLLRVFTAVSPGFTIQLKAQHIPTDRETKLILGSVQRSQDGLMRYTPRATMKRTLLLFWMIHQRKLTTELQVCLEFETTQPDPKHLRFFERTSPQLHRFVTGYASPWLTCPLLWHPITTKAHSDPWVRSCHRRPPQKSPQMFPSTIVAITESITAINEASKCK